MKKLLSCLLAISLAIGLLTSCGTSEIPANRPKSMRIAVTTFPQYDWVRQILGRHVDSVELTLLLDKGVDLHSYQPSTNDIMAISNCDLFIYVGGESDEWVDDALKTNAREGRIVINLMEVLGDLAKEEEHKEGMEAGDHDHDHADADASHGEESHEEELDEHVWLSLRNAEVFCSYIAEKLGELDPANAKDFKVNADQYIRQLGALDDEYQAAADGAAQKTLVFADRFPFLYLTKDYGLDYFAAFSGCSAETEASFETVVFLANKMDELGLKNVMVLEGTDHAMAETVIRNTKAKNQNILALNSMQSVTAADVEAGTTYLSIMEKNFTVFQEALR